MRLVPQGYTCAILMLFGQLNRRSWLIVLTAAVTAVAVLVLAIGVDQLELKPGRPLTIGPLDPSRGGGLINRIRFPGDLLDFLGGLLRVAVLALLPFAIVNFIRSRAARRRVLTQLLYLLLFSVALLSISRTFRPRQSVPPAVPAPAAALPGVAGEAAAVLPEAPAWLLTTASLLTASAVALAAYRLFLRARQEPTVEAQLADSARGALDDLASGAELESVVLRAYFQLCQASRRRRGLQRAPHQTAHEYGGDLRLAGLPDEPVKQLTGLFEKARYGALPLDADDERTAIASLRAILRWLGEL